MTALHGHGNVTANVCFDCQGPLRQADGSFSERMYDDGRNAFAAALCVFCKHIADLDREGKLTTDVDATIKRLRAKNDGVDYAVAMWMKTVTDHDEREVITRQYVVTMSGAVHTRRDTCDLQRSLKSYRTAGWQVYTPKMKIRDAKHAIEVIDKALVPQGYMRRI